jgi:hypothetical protein
MRSGVLAFLAVLAVGLLALIAIGLTRGSPTIYTLGVAPQGPVAQLKPGSKACQGVVELPDGASYDRIGLYPRSAGAPGAAVDVTIRPASGGAALARGTLAGGYRAGSPPPMRAVDVGHQRQGGPITVCFENAGQRKLELWGTGAVASPSTSATVDDKPQDFDLGVTFERANERSLIALLPDVAARASVFHPQWVSPVAYTLLAALLVIGGPALLVLALRRAA